MCEASLAVAKLACLLSLLSAMANDNNVYDQNYTP